MEDNELAAEVLNLIIAYRDYQRTQKGLYFLELSIERVTKLLQCRPDIKARMYQLGMILESNGHREL